MRKKLLRFQEIIHHENIIEPGNEHFDHIKGHWKDFFKNDNPLVLELGCGRGEYTTGLARIHPEKNFVGIDVKGERIWVGSTIALEENLSNVAFLRAQVQLLENFFAPGEVDEIWITFPDPRPKIRDIKRRLISPRFLEIYKKITAGQGRVHLKTDNDALFEFSLEILRERSVNNMVYTSNYYDSELSRGLPSIKTNFELKYLAKGHHIKYLSFIF